MQLVGFLLMTALAFGCVQAEPLVVADNPISTIPECPPYDDPKHPVMFPYPNDCRKYLSCFGGQAYPMQCPDNLFWSSVRYRCDYKQYSVCNQSPEYQEIVTYASYPGDCNRYYEKRLRYCPSNLYWNERLQRCDLPQLAGCESVKPWEPVSPSYPPVAPTPPSLPLSPPHSGISYNPINNLPVDPVVLCQSSQSNSYIPYPGDCHKFIYCGQTATVHTCAGNTFWDSVAMSCGPFDIVCRNI